MKILIICNNIEGNYDGIGKHARIVGEEMHRRGYCVEYLSGKTWNKGILGKFFSFEMSKAFAKAIKRIDDNEIDWVIIEYPFSEYNPLIMFPHIILYLRTRKRKTKIAFSMHEYDRVQTLRRKIIDVFLKFSDLVFVSEKKYFSTLAKYRHKMTLRTISNNISSPNEEKIIDKSTYCYIGLVNSSKAFTEMIDAWKIFNTDNKNKLQIVSATDLSDWHFNGISGITYHHNLSNEKAARIIFDSTFSIIPVKPEIGFNNSSMVTSTQCGCIPIGIFNQEIVNNDFLINMNSYAIDDFATALNNSQELSIDEIKLKSHHSFDFGKQFSLEHTVDQMIKGLISK